MKIGFEYLLSTFYGGPLNLVSKYISLLSSFAISPYYYFYLWSFGLSAWAVILVGVIFTVLTFIIIVILVSILISLISAMLYEENSDKIDPLLALLHRRK